MACRMSPTDAAARRQHDFARLRTAMGNQLLSCSNCLEWLQLLMLFSRFACRSSPT